MTRASEYEIEWPNFLDEPDRASDLKRDQLDSLYREGIDRERKIIEHCMTSARHKASRVPIKLCAISNSTNSTLAYQKGAALAEFLEAHNLTELYMGAPLASRPGGHKDNWTARFENPNGSGFFTISYIQGYLEEELTHTQTLSFTARD